MKEKASAERQAFPTLKKGRNTTSDCPYSRWAVGKTTLAA